MVARSAVVTMPVPLAKSGWTGVTWRLIGIPNWSTCVVSRFSCDVAGSTVNSMKS
jgi:hypothetical protein